MHVIVTKPMVKTLAEHIALAEAARKQGTLLCIEVSFFVILLSSWLLNAIFGWMD
jgi:hypothetical protein